MSNALTILPAAPMRMRSRRSSPTRVLCTSISASCMGTPTWSMNSAGAAPVPPSAPSTTMKSGSSCGCVAACSCIALAIPNHSQGWPMASLKPTGLPPESPRSRATNCSRPSGVENAACCAGDTQSSPIGTPRVAEISALTFMAGLGALRELDLDHLHLRVARLRGEALLAEAARLVAATEVARADFPDQVAAGLAVVGRDRAFAGIVVEAALLRPGVERADGRRRQRAEAHRRDVEHAGRIGLRAAAADHDAEIGGIDRRRRQRMVDPFVVHRVGIVQAAERAHVVDALGALVDQGALLARERDLGGVRLDEVLAHLRADRFQAVAEVGEDRVVAAQGAASLQQVRGAEQRKRAEDRHAPPPPGVHERQRQRGERQHQACDVGGVTGHGDSDSLVPGVGIEPTWPCGRGILSPLRLPVSPSGLAPEA